MRFYGPPGMLVRINRKNLRPNSIKMFRFNADGIYETDNPRLINILKRKFKYDEEENQAAVAVTGTETDNGSSKQYKCKKCDYVTDNMGDLLVHYRYTHKSKSKEKGA